ncbi:Na(+) H(+) antiporter subunit G [hydrothermal vent metagenome]|uniref:Na(+) H(+) antiporter subunit G n=1 Tax=hydrothermal vent metagenome TaxID=652676 RepID=A0A3B0URX4_9ZZZZ
MTLLEWVVAILMFLGTVFVLGASLGLLRMPDIFLQMSAATKSATLGVGFLLLAAAVYFQNSSVTSRAIAIILFLFLTVPVAAHRLARAAYFVGVPLAEETHLDELRDYYDLQTPELDASEEANPRKPVN